MKPLRFTCLAIGLLAGSAWESSAQAARSFAGVSAGLTLGDLRGSGLSTAVRVGATAGVFGVVCSPKTGPAGLAF
jgi:hypothetical protein